MTGQSGWLSPGHFSKLNAVTARIYRRTAPRDEPGNNPPDLSRTISALEGQIEALKGQMSAIEGHNATLCEQAADLKAERDRALARVEELEKALEQARAVETSAVHQSAWAGEGNSDSAAEIEKLWRRVAELEHKRDEEGSLPQALLEAITADLEREGSVPAPEPEAREDTAAPRPRRWWRRLLRRHEPDPQ